MEVIVSNGRNQPSKDPVIDKQGVFKKIAEESLKPAEKARIKKHQQKQDAIIKTKIWSIKAIAKRLSDWLHLKKPES